VESPGLSLNGNCSFVKRLPMTIESHFIAHPKNSWLQSEVCQIFVATKTKELNADVPKL
jgi:hypothetical protein